MVKIKAFVRTNVSGSECEAIHEVDDKEWYAMSVDERNLALDEIAETHLQNCADFGAYVIGGDGDVY